MDHPAPDCHEFRAGDVAACYGTDWFPSRLIRWGTMSVRRPILGPSHVALLGPSAVRLGDDRPCVPVFRSELPLPGAKEIGAAAPSQPPGAVWWESTTLCPTPCLLQGAHVQGVQAQRPADRIGHYLAGGGRVELYRLTPINALTHDEELRLSLTLIELLGSAYDAPGALLSASRVLQRSCLFPRSCLESLFCSEVVAATLMRVGRMNHDNPARFNPARLIRELLRIGVYQHVSTYR